MLNTLFLTALSFPVLLATAQPAAADASDPAHQRNQVYETVLREGLKVGETTVALPRPTLKAGEDAQRQRAQMLELCGSEQALDDFLRDSVTAPYIMKVRDDQTADAVIRSVDVWFVVRADLSKLDPVALVTSTDGQVVDVANMRFEQHLLTADQLKARNLVAQLEGDVPHWFVHLKSRLLGRIGFEAVDEAMASRDDSSLVIAARVAPTFDTPGDLRNYWKNLAENGPEKPFSGGVSYVKISQLQEPAGALFVEVHAAFAEPRGWFQGAPILRSKFSPIAQDQVRRLRRELLKDRSKPSPP